MATPNYSYEKRQKELAKKRKKEDKLKRKTDGKPDDLSEENTEDTDTPPGKEPAGPGPVAKPPVTPVA